MKTSFHLRAKIEPQPDENIVYLIIYMQFLLPKKSKHGFFSTFAFN